MNKLEEENNMGAVYELASRNYRGKDIEQNHEETFKWFLIVIENGIVEARYCKVVKQCHTLIELSTLETLNINSLLFETSLYYSV